MSNLRSQTTADSWLLSEQQLTCRGSWEDPGTETKYLVGVMEEAFVPRLTDKVRCFVYEDLADQGGGYRIGEGEDGDCSKISSVEDGHRIIEMSGMKTY